MTVFRGPTGCSKSHMLKAIAKCFLSTGACIAIYSTEESRARFLDGIQAAGMRGKKWRQRVIFVKPKFDSDKRIGVQEGI